LWCQVITWQYNNDVDVKSTTNTGSKVLTT